MKALYKSLTVLLLILVAGGFHSCEKNPPVNDEKGSLELFLSMGDLGESLLKSGDPDSLNLTQYLALLTVIDADSVPVLEDELLPLYKFGDGFFSEKIKLTVGHYQLIKFLIINPDGEVIYAAPIEGSPKAYLVKDPLPVGFEILPDETTRLQPEVLPVLGQPPSEFGYSSFGFSIIKPLPFYIAVMIDNPMIMAPVLLTEAVLEVYHPDGWNHTFKLEPQVNKVVIRGGAASYIFIVKVEGFEPKKMEVSARELLATSPEQPMIVRVGPAMIVLKLQPGPEDGIDAMISNLDPDENFGKHPYFEATFISEPILTVMRENQSLIRFRPSGLPKSAQIHKVTLTLFYEVPVPWELDSLYYVYPWGSNLVPCDTIDPTGSVYPCFGAVLQQIVEPWEEDEVTWNNQPKTIEANQVFIPPFVRNCNFIEVDVTRLFIPIQEIAAPNYGMLFKLLPEPYKFPGFRFASSDYKVPEMRPLLKIFYTLPLD